MRIDRLFGILVYLLDSGHASAAELARHFGTSERTIYRDMEALSLAGIPLVAIPGAGGGYQLASGGYKVVFRWPAGEELLRYLMSFGSGLEVVSPPELRSSLRTALESLARLNG